MSCRLSERFEGLVFSRIVPARRENPPSRMKTEHRPNFLDTSNNSNLISIPGDAIVLFLARTKPRVVLSPERTPLAHSANSTTSVLAPGEFFLHRGGKRARASHSARA